VRAAAVIESKGGEIALSAEVLIDEIDVVAVLKERGRRSDEPCVYTVLDGVGTFSTTPTLIDGKGTVVDLRSGKTLAEREFSAELKECPSFINDNESITRGVDLDEVLSWAEGISAGGSGQAASAVE
jgi:hypothetical protein